MGFVTSCETGAIANDRQGHFLGAQHDRRLARFAHERQTPDQIVPFERHLEKEPECDDCAIDARRTHMVPRHMQLKQTKVLARGGFGRAAEESREVLT